MIPLVYDELKKLAAGHLKRMPAGFAQPERIPDIRSAAQAIGEQLAGRSAMLDGEIVRPGPDGRPMFYELMRRRGPFRFYAFDLLWLDGNDLRERPLLDEVLESLLESERSKVPKRRLREPTN